MEIRKHLSVYLESGYLFDDMSGKLKWFEIDKEMFMRPENKDRTFILGTRKTGCDIIILGGANCNESRRG